MKNELSEAQETNAQLTAQRDELAQTADGLKSANSSVEAALNTTKGELSAVKETSTRSQARVEVLEADLANASLQRNVAIGFSMLAVGGIFLVRGSGSNNADAA